MTTSPYWFHLKLPVYIKFTSVCSLRLYLVGFLRVTALTVHNVLLRASR
jgi:hypothetical protein